MRGPDVKAHCNHTRTKIWEPHLAGARKCLDCDMVYNPNRNPVWQFEKELIPYDELLQLAKELAGALKSERCHIVDNNKVNLRCHCLRCEALKKAKDAGVLD
jgi:hypothetical protein